MVTSGEMMNWIDKDLILTEKDLESSIRQFTGRLSIYSRTNRRKILNALHWSRKNHEGQKRESGEPYIIHPLRVAEILIELKMDPSTIISALLHDVLEDTDVSHDELVAHFGEEVCTLVDGVTKIDDINIGKGSRKAASLRKMVWAMVDDLRVILIKLADKRHNMSTLQFIQDDSRRRRIAGECLEIYAPMTGKLGMSSLKSELEDLSFKYLKPDFFAQIRDHVDLKKEERSQHLNEVKQKLIQAALKAKIKVKIEARAKHFYSIYRKMKDRNKDLPEIYDLLGMRIICVSADACYLMLGIVHRILLPLEGRMKDYIAHPKSNGYQSIHTSVLTEGGRRLEIQIRSQKMHETAEYGIAAHWAYKVGKNPDQFLPSEIAVVRQLQVLKAEGHDDAGEFLNAIKQDVLRDSIIVYTPQGEPIELPEGSTAIDFAYHIHSEIGTHCSGARADGSITPLNRPLKNTQTVHILTSKSAHPHVNWLKHVRSSRARNKIRAWLNKNDSSVVIDRDIVAKKSPTTSIKDNAGENKLETQVIDPDKAGVAINNERNTLIKISRCCSPASGEQIIGYISRGRGIIVHKKNCPNLKGIEDFEERRIHVEWETFSHKSIQKFRIHASYTHNLFSKIEGSIRKHQGHLISGSLDENERGELDGFFTIEMLSSDDFKKISRSIRAIPEVLMITRVQNIQNRVLMD